MKQTEEETQFVSNIAWNGKRKFIGQHKDATVTINYNAKVGELINNSKVPNWLLLNVKQTKLFRIWKKGQKEKFRNVGLNKEMKIKTMKIKTMKMKTWK